MLYYVVVCCLFLQFDILCEVGRAFLSFLMIVNEKKMHANIVRTEIESGPLSSFPSQRVVKVRLG